jgi:hypothetical protein
LPDQKTNYTFKALFLLEDFRELLRETAPLHDFDDKQKKQALKILNEVAELINKLKEKF